MIRPECTPKLGREDMREVLMGGCGADEGFTGGRDVAGVAVASVGGVLVGVVVEVAKEVW